MSVTYCELSQTINTVIGQLQREINVLDTLIANDTSDKKKLSNELIEIQDSLSSIIELLLKDE